MASTTWIIDKAHSEITFKVKHMMISTVSGRFNDFDSTVDTDGEDLSTAKIQFSAEVNSIDTRNTQRDGHLKSADFFDAENHPQITFVSTGFDGSHLTGDSTLRGVTKQVTLSVETGGIISSDGQKRAGFEVEGKINRKDFGLSWSALTEAGGMVVADEVKISANVEYVQS